ncbi:hypothetical protein B0H16DRAFT_1477500 [Mycena metata]|uniref:Myb/SANT-like domain-containing protein n=1 Tax=Mycena metata TaxID=1033252 RepID=A0AAD7MFS1_9AGAR|nr:hypothetical protein B0H16DRAFT_1477500 [Mycena metata]
MADGPAPNTVDGTHDDHKPTVKWIHPEVNAMLDELAANKDTHMSGNGFKPAVWGKVVPKVVDANPDPAMKKNKTQCMGKLNYLKSTFTLYIFVRKYSGTGWDEDEHHATNTKEYIEDFTKTHGKEYARCFTTPCPYWTKLNTLFDGMINKATGKNVVHLPTKRRRSRKVKDTTTTPAASSSTSATAASTSRTPLQPIASSSNNISTGDMSLDDDITLIDPELGAAAVGDGGGGAGAFDDELEVVPPSPKAKKRVRADTDDENDDAATEGRGKSKRPCKSGGKARRNAEAGSQILRALENFATVMAQPLVTTEDLSHVNEIVNILKDKSLLPDDPRGKFYRIVSKVLSHDPALARLFILEEDRTRRIGMLEGILEDAGVVLPD